MIRSLNAFLYIVRAVWTDDSNRGQRLWRLFLLGSWQSWKRLICLPMVVPVFNGFRFLAYPDCQISSGSSTIAFLTMKPLCSFEIIPREER